MDLNLRGKVAVLTGASVGIGLAVAEAFAAEGTHLLLAARNEERLSAAAAGIATKFGVTAVPVACDVSTSAGVDKLVAAAKENFGGADIVFNNAGTGSNETIMNAPDEKWLAYWDLHVMAAVRIARGLVPLMKARGGGTILNNASICATQPLGYEPIYNVTKAALMMLSKNMANEFIQDNIRVNTTARQLTQDSGGDWEGHLQQVADEHAPIRRFASPEELANFIVFLCSDKASYSVGSTYFVDGGMLRTV
jgi:NAD(P)-dependent dehydrogenase (short-subunit alcohol dehydrogenase family)